MTKEEIEEAKRRGQPTRLWRKSRKVCFHVLAVTLMIKNTNFETDYVAPVPPDEIDQRIGWFSWNDWLFNGSLIKPDLDVRNLSYRRAS